MTWRLNHPYAGFLFHCYSRPMIAKYATEVKARFQQYVSKREIAKKLGISRTSVRRFLDQPPLPSP